VISWELLDVVKVVDATVLADVEAQSLPTVKNFWTLKSIF